MKDEKQKYQLRYLIMPDYVYQDNDLTDISRRVYCFIHSYNGEQFFFSNKHLAEMFGCAEVSISRAMTQLEELKYIFIDYKIKSEGGKIRFVTDCFNKTENIKSRTIIDDNSELSPVITQTNQERSHKDNKEKIITKSDINNGQAVVVTEAETSLLVDGKTFNETIYLFKPVNPSVNRLFAQKGQRQALERLIKQHGLEKVKGMIELLPLLLKEPYAPIITTPYQLEAKLGQVIAFMERRKHGESKRGIDARMVK